MHAQHVVVSLDVGGTSLKTGVVKSNGALAAGSLRNSAVDSAGTAESILASFAASLEQALGFVRQNDLALDGIGIAIPGPFDYEKGISLIKNLDKYEALYGLNVKQHVRDILELSPELPMLFDNDAWSFGRGEVWVGAGQPYDRVIVFTMGTGVGSAFAVAGRIVDEGPGVPWFGWISGQQYRDGILNDYISRTFMIRRYRELTGRYSERAGRDIDVKQMANLARAGDADAITVFEEVGTELGGFLREHHVQEFGAECIIFGGQIAKSYDLFIGPVKDALQDTECLQAMLPAADIECSALKGAAKYVFDTLADAVD
jgi:glucokinase